MTPVLVFVGVLGAIVVVGWSISKWKGSKAYFIEDWRYDEGETILWRDDSADVAVIPKFGQARAMTPARLHRWPVVVTNSRVIIADKTLTGKGMVIYVLYPRAAPDGQSSHLDGGLLTRGYSTIAIEPDAGLDHLADDTKHPYVVLTPVDGERSSTNLFQFRIYTDHGADFRLP